MDGSRRESIGCLSPSSSRRSALSSAIVDDGSGDSSANASTALTGTRLAQSAAPKTAFTTRFFAIVSSFRISRQRRGNSKLRTRGRFPWRHATCLGAGVFMSHYLRNSYTLHNNYHLLPGVACAHPRKMKRRRRPTPRKEPLQDPETRSIGCFSQWNTSMRTAPRRQRDVGCRRMLRSSHALASDRAPNYGVRPFFDGNRKAAVA